jgi:DNA-binding transcriptional LysR family regulator
MNLRSLQLFRQIVITGSLSDASRNLFLSTSAASRLLNLLEQDIDLKLFSREKRSLILTEEGDLFYRRISKTLDGLEEISSVSADIRNRTTNWLSVVTAAPLANTLVSPALAVLQREIEGFQCTLSAETRFDIESKVSARGYNLGIISLPVENAILDLQVEPFLKSRVEILLPRDHPLAALEELSMEDIAWEHFVALAPRQRWRQRLDELMGAAGHTVNIPIETSSTVVTVQMVRDGLGITMIDRATRL